MNSNTYPLILPVDRLGLERGRLGKVYAWVDGDFFLGNSVTQILLRDHSAGTILQPDLNGVEGNTTLDGTGFRESRKPNCTAVLLDSNRLRLDFTAH